MKVYTAQEWQIKFKEQAGNDKQLLHDLECTGLVKEDEAQKLLKEQKLVSDSDLESWKKYIDYQLKQKDGIIDRLNETIEHQENDSIILENQIKKFKTIAKHVQEHCCDDCEDNTMCEFGCAITELKLSLCEKPTGEKK
jgi:oligoribonuclease (3'-5' exoribonuclease)